MDFAVPADHREKLKESEKQDKYLDLTRKLNKLRNMKVTFIPIVIGDLGTATEGLIKGLEDLEITGRLETIQTTALLRSARIPRRVSDETCCNSDSSERPLSNDEVKNSQRGKIIMMIGIIIIIRKKQDRRENPNYPDYSIHKISQNTKKSPEDQNHLAVTQITVKTQQPTLE